MVLATLVVQGLTLGPLVRWLKLDGEDGLAAELASARADLAGAGLGSLDGQTGPVADHWRYAFETSRAARDAGRRSGAAAEQAPPGPHGPARQRQRLEDLRSEDRVGADSFLILQEELDFQEVTLSSEAERHIEES